MFLSRSTLSFSVVVGLALIAFIGSGSAEPASLDPSRDGDYGAGSYGTGSIEHDLGLIKQWSEDHTPTTFAGVFFVDRMGGLLRVGYTADQSRRLRAAKRSLSLRAPRRIVGFTSPPAHSLRELRTLRKSIEREVIFRDEYRGLIHSWNIAVPINQVRVWTVRRRETIRLLAVRFGRSAPIDVRYGPAPVELLE